MALASPVVSRPLYEADISVYRHVVPGLYLAMTLNHSGGLALRWFRDGFCEADVLRAARDGVDAYDLMLPDAVAGPTGLLVLPHFSGSAARRPSTPPRGPPSWGSPSPPPVATSPRPSWKG